MTGGESFTNLSSNANIFSDLSVYGDYLITGSIKKQGKECHLHVELLTACSRKIVAASDIRFQLASVMENMVPVSQQIALELSPLGDKIKKYELDERQKDKSLSLL